MADPAYAIVENQLELARAYANTAFNSASTALSNLASFTVSPVEFAIDFDEENIQDLVLWFWPDFHSELNLNKFTGFEYEDPGAAPTTDVHVPNVGAVPQFNETKPTLDFGAKPGSLDPETFVSPDLDDVDLPDELVLTIEDAPDLSSVDLSDLDDLDLTIPSFDVEAPDDPLPDFDVNWTYSNEHYSSDLITLIKAQITEAINNGSGLPAAVEDQLFERAVAREERSALRARRTVSREFAARGWSLPQGAESKRLDEVTQTQQEKRSDLSRDIYITRRKEEVEIRLQYLTQGIAMESALINEHIAYFQRALEVGRILVDTSIAVFNAHVQKYNLQFQIFRAKIERFRALVEAELAKVEELKAQLEIRRLRVQVNQQEIERYIAYVQGVAQRVAIYEAQIRGAEAVARVNTERVNVFRSEIEAYRAKVQAKEAEFRAWGEGVRGELGRVDAFRALAEVYGRRVDAYRTGVDAEVAQTNADVQIGQLRTQEFLAKVESARAKLEGHVEKLRAVITKYDADVAKFRAEIEGKTAESNAKDRKTEIAISQNRNAADISVAATQLNIQQLLEASAQAKSVLESIGQITSNLAASALSSSNASANLSAS